MYNIRRKTKKWLRRNIEHTNACWMVLIISFKNAVDEQFYAIFITDWWEIMHKTVLDHLNKLTIAQ